MDNAATGVSVPLSTFGGLSTELSPSDLPEGGSPDNQDVAFQPGSVLTRPGLSRVYASPPTATAIVYQKTFTRLDGKVFNVVMDSNGAIWSENFTDNPAAFTQVGSVPAGSFCKSVEAYGKLFMAFNDGFRGTDIVRKFDGTKFSRVSQGGPAGNPSFGEFIGAAVTLGNSASPVTIAITSLASSDPQDVTTRFWNTLIHNWDEFTTTIYTTLTLTVSSSAGFVAGGIVTWTGNAALNLTDAVIASVGVGTIVVLYSDSTFRSGAGGSITMSQPTMSRSNNIVTASVATAHGLAPGDMFTISSVGNTVVGTGISAAVRLNNVTTFSTSSTNGARTGAKVVIAGVTDTTFNGTWDVTAVISPTAFQVTSSNLVDSTSSAGTVSTMWNNDKRFVITAPTSTTLTYEDVGCDAQTSNVGILTPVGQVAGGTRHAVCHFLTDDGYITGPSYPIRISASGNKKLVASSIPIGPANIAARVCSFTGVDGGAYFYIPVPARNNGNAISTSTVVNDNTSTSALFDFSDDTLLSATAIDVDGNNLFRLKILGNCSGVDLYADRLLWWGDENKAINFQNMGFEGGIDAGGTPSGWNVTGTGLSVITVADFGDGIQFAAASTAQMTQQAYLDYYGDQILEPNTQYTFKCWASKSAGSPNVVAEIYDSVGLSVLATVTIPITSGFISGKFSAKTPAIMPTGAVLRVYVTNNAAAVVTLDELSCIFADNPYNDTTFATSYIQNPESIDAVTGIMGATADPTPIMDTGRLRDNFYFVTQARLHTTKDQESSEPSGWSVNEVAAQCGACTMQGMISGENWLSWPAKDGARMFDGSQPVKITQDIQSVWESINQSALNKIWAVNDSEKRMMYWGVPTGVSTLTNKVFMLDYRFAETASEIEDRASVRISAYTGKMLVLDLSRKFSPWSIPATAGGFLTTTAGKVATFSDGSGRTYRLDPAKLNDDDYGTIPAYYVTSPFVSGDMEQQFQLGNNRHLYTFLSLFVFGTGKLTITPLENALSNAWPARGPYTMSQDPQRMFEVPLNVAAERAFFKFSATPIAPSLDAAFSVSRMNVVMAPHPMSPISGKK